MIYLNFKNSQKAWEGIHHYFLNNEEEISKNGGGRYGGQMVAVNMFVKIDRPWVKPTFDFGNTFGYRKQKWSTLVNNYVDREYLKEFKEKIQDRENKNSRAYNISMPFTNKHGHGKNCLLSITASRRYSSSKPIISFTLRSSEITKRLLLDLLLVQRIAEYVYGKTKVEIEFHAINIYLNPEAFTMYDSFKPIDKMLPKGELSAFQNKVLKILHKFKTVDIKDIKYKVHKRCVRQLQRPNGHPLSGDRPMLAKELKL